MRLVHYEPTCAGAPLTLPAVPPLLRFFCFPKVRQLSVWLKWQAEHSMERVEERWWWLVGGIFLSRDEGRLLVNP